MKTNSMQLRGPRPSPGAATPQAQAPRHTKVASPWHASAPEEGRAPAFGKQLRRSRGFLQVDLAVGKAILAIAVLPLAYSFVRERQMLRIEYGRCIANEIVDGEMEILAAGAAKNLPDGTQNYTVHANAANMLPPGHFELAKNGNHLRLAWMPDKRRGISAVVRETMLK